jgi:hypothetical protein
VRELEKSFTRFRQPRADGEAGGRAATEEEHRIFAADLVAALGVNEETAEEMIYIADLQENEAITFTEFRQSAPTADRTPNVPRTHLALHLRATY